MGFVYILKSECSGKYYIGSTKDIQRRINQHNSKMHPSSKRLAPFKVMLSQEYPDIKTARLVESRLKKLKRRDYIEKIISDGYIKILGH